MQLRPRTGFINQINRLIGKEPIGNVAIRQLDGFNHRVIADLHAVMFFIAIPQSLNNLHGLFNGRRVHVNRLKPTLQGPVFLNVLAIFIKGRRPDTLNFTTRQRRFEHVGGINRPFGRAGPDQGVQLINEQNHVAGLGNFFHDHLESFFKLSAVLRAGHERPQIQGNHPSV